MKKYFFLFTCLLFLENLAFAQIEVKGNVIGEHGEALPTVVIKEKYTENETTTNFDGEFSIKCLDEQSILVFNFVGMKTQEVSIEKDTVLNVILADSDSLDEIVVIFECYGLKKEKLTVPIEVNSTEVVDALAGKIICLSFQKEFQLGLNTGLNHNQLGIETQNLISSLFPYKFQNSIFSYSKWRFLTKNNYLKFGIGNYNILHLGNDYPVSLGLKGNYQQVSLENSGFSTKQYSFSSTVKYRGFISSVGYAHREIKNHQDLNYSKNGIAFGFENISFRKLNLKANAIYWSDDWQYSFDVDIDIPKTRINLGFGWEKINSWEEFDISILYSFFY
jgi:hypothetical protein